MAYTEIVRRFYIRGNTLVVYKIRRVGISSAFRLGFLFGMVVTVAGVIFTVLVSLLGLSALSGSYYGRSSGIGLISIVSVVLSGFIGGAIASVIAGIVTAFYAWIYNIIAGGGNGLELTLDQSSYPEKTKFSG